MKIGLIVPQGWRTDLVGYTENPIAAYEAMTNVAHEADTLGYHSIWLFDHFHTVPKPLQEVTFECWTSTAALARDTQRVRIGQMVTCNSYRNPSLLAKIASTVDVLSHGRLDFGIGAGWYEHEYKAYGYEYPETGTRLKQLREAVQICLAMWTQDEAHFEGQYYHLNGAINQPKGVQKPHIPLLIGGSGEKVTLKLVAQYGDACNISGADIPTLKHKLAVLHKHCETFKRDPATIRTTILMNCYIGDTEKDAERTMAEDEKATIADLREHAFVGTPEQIRERMALYAEAGVDEAIIYLRDAAQLESVRYFAKECLSI